MSTEPTDDDLNAALARAYPQGFALLRFEGGTGLVRIGAREVLRNPSLARGTVAPRGLRGLARALRACGQRDIACADRLEKIAAEEENGEESAQPKARSRVSAADMQPTNMDSIKTGGGDA
jgi:hypothetical protein